MRRGQTILEYAVVAVCVTAALISMMIYIKRGVSGGLKEAADNLGPQYHPEYTQGQAYNETTKDIDVISIAVPGYLVRDDLSNEGALVLPDPRYRKQIRVEEEHINNEHNFNWQRERVWPEPVLP